MRLFIGIPISDGMRREAAVIVEILKSAGADYRWVEAENLHFTLHFLGETPEDKVDPISGVMRAAAGTRRRWTISPGRIGVFDSPKSPRVIWIGLSQGAQEMTHLAGQLAAGLESSGLRLEKRDFHPHLTIGRMRSPKNLARLREILDDPAKVPSFKTAMDVGVMNLYRSHLCSSGPIYDAILEAAFPSE